jgi:hypothetical protein
MRSFILTLIVAFLGMGSMNAQLNTPQPSPSAELEQQVGLTDVIIKYSRPSMKGRTIFGDLVPMNTLWRTGANRNTTIEFSTDVTVGGEDLKAGTYALFTKPMANEWEVYFYTDTNNNGTPGAWDDTKVAAKVMAKSMKLPITMETMMLNIGSITNNSADFQLVWENTMVSFPIVVPTKEIVQKSIDKVMAGPSNRDYYDAAGFYLDEKENLATALEYVNKAISMDYEKFWTVRRKALILAEMDNYEEAIKAAERSLELAKAANYDAYIRMNEKSIAEWKKMK